MTEPHVVFTRHGDSQTAFAMRTKTWDTMVRMHKDKYGDGWEKKMDCTLVGQHLTETQAEALAELIKKEST